MKYYHFKGYISQAELKNIGTQSPYASNFLMGLRLWRRIMDTH